MPFYIIFIIASFFASLAGLYLVKENRVTVLIIFSVFLFASSAVELLGWQMSLRGQHTILMYNLFAIFEFIFYLFFFRSLFSNKRVKKVILITIFFYISITLSNILFFQGLGDFNSYTYVLGCMMIVVFSIVYFYFLFRLPERVGLLQNTYFWIVTGLMFFYTCTFALYGLNNFITEKMGFYNNLLTFISDILNALLYSLFIIGFLCQINLRKLLRSS